MKREFFNRQFAALCAAYAISNKLSDESQDVYWELLQDISEKDFAVGVRACLASCKFFPTIAELGDASLPPLIESGPWVQTKNGMDRMPVKIGWQKQIERKRNAFPLPDTVRVSLESWK